MGSWPGPLAPERAGPWRGKVGHALPEPTAPQDPRASCSGLDAASLSLFYLPVSAHQLHLAPQVPPVLWAWSSRSAYCWLCVPRRAHLHLGCGSPRRLLGIWGAPVLRPCMLEAQSHSRHACPGSRVGSLAGGWGLLGAVCEPKVPAHLTQPCPDS